MSADDCGGYLIPPELVPGLERLFRRQQRRSDLWNLMVDYRPWALWPAWKYVLPRKARIRWFVRELRRIARSTPGLRRSETWPFRRDNGLFKN